MEVIAEEMNAKERADELLAAIATHAAQKDALIAELLLRRTEINEALQALGHSTPRKRKPGRPVGAKTRNRTAAVAALPKGTNAAQESGL